MLSRRLFAMDVSMVAVLLAGCGAHRSFLSPQPQSTTLSGRVHGGQQPVAYSTVVLYTVGTGGDGSIATTLDTTSTDANGNFTLTGQYSCASATEVYITSTGGQPSPGVTNNNLLLMSALGSCTALQATPFIIINELTTVAAVNALAPYITSATAIGSGTSDVAAMDAGFTLASEYVNPTTGSAPGANVPNGYTVPVAEIDTLGNALAACVNTGGGIANDMSACGYLFADTTPTGSSAPTNTLMALLNLANNPTLSTSGIYTLGSTYAQFQPSLAVQPTTFAVSLIVGMIGALTAGTAQAWDTAYTLQDITVTNTGTLPISFTAATGTSNFAYTGNSCSGTIPGLSTCTLTVESLGCGSSGAGPFSFTDTLTITDSATNGPQAIPLHSTNSQCASTAPVFGSVAVGNTASSVLDIRGVYVDYGIPGGIIFGGLDPEDFNDPDSMPTQGLGLLGYGQCLAGPLGLGCGGTIIFKPTAAGTRTARIYINPNAYPAGIEYINVSGTAY